MLSKVYECESLLGCLLVLVVAGGWQGVQGTGMAQGASNRVLCCKSQAAAINSLQLMEHNGAVADGRGANDSEHTSVGPSRPLPSPQPFTLNIAIYCCSSSSYTRYKLRSRLHQTTPSLYTLTSQPFSACNCRRGNYFSGPIPGMFFFVFPFFSLFFFLFYFCFVLF